MGTGKHDDCYVAFIDILGFKKQILDGDCESIRQIFEEIVDFKPSNPVLRHYKVYEKIKIHIMSDSIIVYVKTKYDGAFVALMDVCLQIQVMLAQHTPPVLVRGGIDRGYIYHKENIIFGTGFVKAYNLEKTIAKYPRIVFTRKLKDSALDCSSQFYQLYDSLKGYDKEDDDMLCYIDFLGYSGLYRSTEDDFEKIGRTRRQFVANLKHYVDEELASEKDCSIREKHIWLKHKLEAVHLSSMANSSEE